MKSIGKILLFVFFIFCMFLLKPRQDVVFEAIDMSQYIRLFEEDRDFVLSIDQNSTFTGTYTLEADTVFLYYQELAQSTMAAVSPGLSDYRTNLPRKLFIDENASQIESSDGQLFSAEISLDLRETPMEETAYTPGKRRDYRAQILAFAGLKD